jgi:pyridinium-3,5-biscarboxylic acid mononucleotide sulfurtransferase
MKSLERNSVATNDGEESPAPAPIEDRDAKHKERELVAWLRARGSALVGFSGGVDSVYLAFIARGALGPERMLAVIGRSASYPSVQWEIARKVADDFDIPVRELDTDEMNDPRYAANPVNRCYFCKGELWTKLIPLAVERELSVVLDGTNADDLSDYRPGAKAAEEHGVLSPLALLGFTKQDIRARSRAHGLPTWSQPSAPCLSSRVPYGTAVTAERLLFIERAEEAIRALGVTGDLRVRYHGELARVELSRDEVPKWLDAARQRQLAHAVRQAGFQRVAIDLAGFRSGSLNVLTGVVTA